MTNQGLRAAVRAFIGVLAANIAFAALALLAAAAPPPRYLPRIANYFDRQQLVHSDYLEDYDPRGENQYNDCMMLEMIGARDIGHDGIGKRAFAPPVYVTTEDYEDVCLTFDRLSRAPGLASTLIEDDYARYWHGYVPIATALLWIGDIWFVRAVLAASLIGSIGLFAFRGWRAGRAVRVFALCVAAAALLFWALPLYGQGLTTAPGEAALFLGLAAFASRPGGQDTAFDSAQCALFGAVIAYLDFLTGALPTAGALFVVLMGLRASTLGPAGDTWLHALGRWVAPLVWFVAGAVVTVLAKQVISLLLFGSGPLQAFVDHLMLYSGGETGSGGFLQDHFVSPFAALRDNIQVLTYGYRPAARILFLLALIGWVGATLLAWTTPARLGRERVAIHLAGGIVVLGWILVLPTHTAIHAEFMIRILMPTIALGFSAFAGQILARRAGNEKGAPIAPGALS